ncbi:uncharacterized protein TNCV_840821 [Trichonephila clavipes]|nr:uncharacterized protein TNCV_840821 [Trichonephila clavipes]
MLLTLKTCPVALDQSSTRAIAREVIGSGERRDNLFASLRYRRGRKEIEEGCFHSNGTEEKRFEPRGVMIPGDLANDECYRSKFILERNLCIIFEARELLTGRQLGTKRSRLKISKLRQPDTLSEALKKDANKMVEIPEMLARTLLDKSSVGRFNAKASTLAQPRGPWRIQSRFCDGWIQNCKEKRHIVCRREKHCLLLITLLREWKESLSEYIFSFESFTSQRIIGRLECGRTQLEVSEELGIAQSVISRLWQRFQDDGNVSRCYSTGRPRVTTPNEDRFSLQSNSRRTLIWRVPGTHFHQENNIERPVTVVQDGLFGRIYSWFQN